MRDIDIILQALALEYNLTPSEVARVLRRIRPNSELSWRQRQRLRRHKQLQQISAVLTREIDAAKTAMAHTPPNQIPDDGAYP